MRVVVKGDFSLYVVFHSCSNLHIHEISFLRKGEGASELGAERERDRETEGEREEGDREGERSRACSKWGKCYLMRSWNSETVRSRPEPKSDA